MRTRKLYLDTCILVGLYDRNDSKHKKVKKFFKKASKMEHIRFFCSDYTIVEFTKVMLIDKKFSEKFVYKSTTEILLTGKLHGKYPVVFTELQKKYKKVEKDVFSEFFIDVQHDLLDVKYTNKDRPNLADVIHAVIMKKNQIKTIITFDKKDFENIHGITPIEPKEL